MSNNLESSLPGMQPDSTSPNPSSPNPDYDFILKDQPKPKKSFRIPSFGLPKKAAAILGGALLLFLLVVIGAAIFKGGGNSASITGVLGRAQEILRVSKVAEPLAQDTDTQALIATTEAAFASQQTGLTAYLSKAGTKIDTKSLTLYQDKNVDAQMQAAAQNNSLGNAYTSYLKKSLADYQNALQSAAKGASPARLSILQDAFVSTKTLLAAPQIANAQ